MSRTYHIFDLLIVGSNAAASAALDEALRHSDNVALAAADNLKGMDAALWQASREAFSAEAEKGAKLKDALRAVRKSQKAESAQLAGRLQKHIHNVIPGRASIESPRSIRVENRLFHAKSVLLCLSEETVLPDHPTATTVLRFDMTQRIPRHLPEKMLVTGKNHQEFAEKLRKLGVDACVAPAIPDENRETAVWPLDTMPHVPKSLKLDQLKLPLDALGIPLRHADHRVEGTALYILTGGEEQGRAAARHALQKIPVDS